MRKAVNVSKYLVLLLLFITTVHAQCLPVANPFGSVPPLLCGSKLSTTLPLTIGPGGTVSAWATKITVNYTAGGFTAAATGISIALDALPTGAVISGVKLKHSTAWAGTGVTSVTVSLGDGTDHGSFSPAFNVFQATGAAVLHVDGGNRNASGITPTLRFTFNTNAGNGSATVLTAGVLDVWISWSVAN